MGYFREISVNKKGWCERGTPRVRKLSPGRRGVEGCKGSIEGVERRVRRGSFQGRGVEMYRVAGGGAEVMHTLASPLNVDGM